MGREEEVSRIHPKILDIAFTFWVKYIFRRGNPLWLPFCVFHPNEKRYNTILLIIEKLAKRLNYSHKVNGKWRISFKNDLKYYI